jgi:hypothetical protein
LTRYLRRSKEEFKTEYSVEIIEESNKLSFIIEWEILTENDVCHFDVWRIRISISYSWWKEIKLWFKSFYYKWFYIIVVSKSLSMKRILWFKFS